MTYVGLVFTYLLVLSPCLLPYGLILWACTRLTRGKSLRLRTGLLVAVVTLLFTPVWGPATIAVVPVSFGVLLAASSIALSWSGLMNALELSPAWWYAVAFPATAIVAYGCIRLLLSNNSPKPTPLRGAA
jgi:hypothetical protein